MAKALSGALTGRLLLVGAGKMGSALLAGWLAEGLDPGAVLVSDPAPPDDIQDILSAHKIALNPDIASLSKAPPQVVVLAVKPQIMDGILPGLQPIVGPTTVFLSIAAGKTIAAMKEGLGGGAAVVRSIPNTPAAIGRGITVACSGTGVSIAQEGLCTALLEAVGEVAWVADEALIDPVTAISGSGPAYTFYFVECLAEAGEALGLDPALAMQLARATVSGAGELMQVSGELAADLRKNVTSPGGTTEAALEVLMSAQGLKPLMQKAAERARDRAGELA